MRNCGGLRPLSHPSYELLLKGGELSISPLPVLGDWMELKVVVLTTGRKQRIPAVYIVHREAEFTLICSHGNGTDIGETLGEAVETAARLRVSVLCYEYTGYGQSTGKASEKDIFADIEAAYSYLLHDEAVPWHKIILFGQSLGTGPACWLAASRPVAGVVLVSPFMSGLRLVRPRCHAPSFDVFNNITRVEYINCPCFLIHGTEDTVIPISHSKALLKHLRTPAPPWWVSGAGHNNVQRVQKTEYFSKLQNFLCSISHLQRFLGTEEKIMRELAPGAAENREERTGILEGC